VCQSTECQKPLVASRPFVESGAGETRYFLEFASLKKAGVSRQTVAFIEQGLRNPTMNTLFRLTSALEVEPEENYRPCRKLAGS